MTHEMDEIHVTPETLDENPVNRRAQPVTQLQLLLVKERHVTRLARLVRHVTADSATPRTSLLSLG